MRKIISRAIKKEAFAALADRHPPYGRLVFTHAAVSSAFMLMVSLIGFVLERTVADTTGLDGFGTAAALKTVHMTLSVLGNILLPFWQLGLLYTSVRVIRGQNAQFPMLAQGFRRIRPLVGYYAMFLLIIFAVAMACFYALVLPFSCMPIPPELETAINALDFTDAAQIMAFQEEYYQEILLYSAPFLVVFSIVYGAVVLNLNYRFRMCGYLLLEDQRAGVMQSFRLSSRMTKSEKKNLFLLDLSFWWYHLLSVLASGVAFAPDMMQAAGIALPVSYETASLLAYLAYVLCYLALAWFAGAYYQTSMACAYEKLRISTQEERKSDNV